MEKKQSLLERRDTFWIFALLCAALWGSATVCNKVAFGYFAIESADTANQILFAGVRFTLAGLMAVAFFSLTGRKFLFPSYPGEWKHSFVLALEQVAVLYGVFNIGVAHASGVMSVMVNATCTFFTILLAAVPFRFERLTAGKLFACLLGFSAIAVMNIGGFKSGIRFSFAGEGLLIIAQLLSGLGHNITRVYTKKDSPVVLCAWQFLMGGPLLIVVGKLMGGKLVSSSPLGWLVMGYLAFVAIAAFTMWDILLQHHPVSKVSIFSMANPVFGVLFSALLLGETAAAFRPVTLLALLMVAGGIVIVNKREASCV